ncbi:hypothetical protein QW71_06400 [Paenibacillus sp. IHB B 3415]|uniref:hypothetical protein n=1 Tax=Paenibacillus sp. IHB B 3415 TaxID=867080 RepID=UPI000574A190|nr:hypothetical protein [Paenibacillus sp. IHB B 3415]KHL96562.1 hypothetical protein QW71_06400 [Paenibacillus sp. IHB B 3415]
MQCVTRFRPVAIPNVLNYIGKPEKSLNDHLLFFLLPERKQQWKWKHCGAIIHYQQEIKGPESAAR